MLKTRSLNYTYPGGQAIEYPDLDISPGEEWLITGASGVGKSTLIHLLSGLLRAGSRQIDIDGTDIASLSPKALDRFRGEHIGLIFQAPAFMRSLSLRENLELVASIKGKVDHARLDQLLEAVDLKDKAHQKPRTLSEGERQRAGIALALIHRPKYLLADEPTASLDDERAQQVLELLRQQAEENGSALIIITHDQRLKSSIEKQIAL